MKTNKWSIVHDIFSILVAVAVFFSALYLYINLPYIVYFATAASILLYIVMYKQYYKAKPMSQFNNKYVYHLLNAEKLKKIEKDGCFHIKPTKGFLSNYSGLGKKFVYFHSDFKKFSYCFNHLFKKELPTYLMIVPTANLNKEKMHVRKIDGAVLYESDYVGKAKVVRADKFQFIKHIDFKCTLLLVIDLMQIVFLNMFLFNSIVILLGAINYNIILIIYNIFFI